jgi:hypothetical protein
MRRILKCQDKVSGSSEEAYKACNDCCVKIAGKKSGAILVTKLDGEITSRICHCFE